MQQSTLSTNCPHRPLKPNSSPKAFDNLSLVPSPASAPQTVFPHIIPQSSCMPPPISFRVFRAPGMALTQQPNAVVEIIPVRPTMARLSPALEPLLLC